MSDLTIIDFDQDYATFLKYFKKISFLEIRNSVITKEIVALIRELPCFSGFKEFDCEMTFETTMDILLLVRRLKRTLTNLYTWEFREEMLQSDEFKELASVCSSGRLLICKTPSTTIPTESSSIIIPLTKIPICHYETMFNLLPVTSVITEHYRWYDER